MYSHVITLDVSQDWEFKFFNQYTENTLIDFQLEDSNIFFYINRDWIYSIEYPDRIFDRVSYLSDPTGSMYNYILDRI